MTDATPHELEQFDRALRGLDDALLNLAWAYTRLPPEAQQNATILARYYRQIDHVVASMTLQRMVLDARAGGFVDGGPASGR